VRAYPLPRIRWSPLRLVALYAVLGCLWIFASDLILIYVVKNPFILTRLQIARGLLYVVATVLFIYLVTRHYFASARRSSTELTRSEERFQLLLDGVRDYAILMLDPEGRVRSWNAAAELITGHRNEEIVGRHFSIFYPPEEAAGGAPARMLERVKAAGSIFDEGWRVRKDGTRFWASVAVTPLRDADGGVRGFSMVTRDVTARKKTEDALRDSESKYRTLFEGSADGIFLMTDLFTDCNEQACRLWKCRREDIVGHSPVEFSPPLQPDGQSSETAARNRIERALAGDPQYFYWQHQTKDGALLDTEVSLKALTISGKTFLLATVRDVSARKRAERKLTEANRALTARSKCSRALICATEEVALLKEVCRIVVEDCGYRLAWVGFAEPGPGKAVRPVAWTGTGDSYLSTIRITWADDAHGRSPTGTAIRTGAPSIARDIATDPRFAPWREEAKKRGDASSISLPLLDGGTAFGAISIYASEPDSFRGEEVQLLTELSSDLAYGITALRTRAARARAQEELEQYRDRLEEMVKERTAQLAESNRRLEMVNRELEAFSYSASHDLRAPLRSMDGFSQALLEDYGGTLDEKARDYLGRIKAASRNMAELIDDLLSLSRVTRSEMRIGEVDLSAMAESILSTLARTEPGRSVEFAVAPGATARCDPRLLRIVMENLLGNAWKFTGKKPKARIEFGAVSEGGRKVFRVRDNGAGFEMEYVGKLFNPFQRLHASGDFPGTGIGLAIVQRIIHRHGGTVWAEGKPDAGATFCFTL